MPPSPRLRYARWEMAMGFLGFFAAVAVVSAVANLWADPPSIWPGIIAAALIGLCYVGYRRRPGNPGAR